MRNGARGGFLALIATPFLIGACACTHDHCESRDGTRAGAPMTGQAVPISADITEDDDGSPFEPGDTITLTIGHEADNGSDDVIVMSYSVSYDNGDEPVSIKPSRVLVDQSMKRRYKVPYANGKPEEQTILLRVKSLNSLPHQQGRFVLHTTARNREGKSERANAMAVIEPENQSMP